MIFPEEEINPNRIELGMVVKADKLDIQGIVASRHEFDTGMLQFTIQTLATPQDNSTKNYTRDAIGFVPVRPGLPSPELDRSHGLEPGDKVTVTPHGITGYIEEIIYSLNENIFAVLHSPDTATANRLFHIKQLKALKEEKVEPTSPQRGAFSTRIYNGAL